jgi:hypothetical protein
MTMMSYETHTIAELSEAYRLSFREFIQKLRRVQSLEANLDNGAEVVLALLELERARIAYYSKRDALVQDLLPSGGLGHVQRTILGSTPLKGPHSKKSVPGPRVGEFNYGQT